ncbi:MAG: NFACT family protein [Lachnospiraceae bacterium]|nr:NFACT family protein [Lachnospiraceae bacterium]
MALDGITTKALTKEFSDKLTGGRIVKISQPEPDELLLTIKNNGEQQRLRLCASATLPYAALTDSNKQAPMTAPNFCMLLRKHLQNGRLLKISQPGLERVIEFEIEHLNEMGDLCRKSLIIELMGKHSNIILVNEERMILDSIKHISVLISSVREVLPGKPYFIPETVKKLDPFRMDYNDLSEALRAKPAGCLTALYQSVTGFSPVIASELIFRSGADGDIPAKDQSDAVLKGLFNEVKALMNDAEEGLFQPNIIYDSQKPVEFAAVRLSQYSDLTEKLFSSISDVLNTYYSEKEVYTRIRQKSSDLRKIVQTHLERNVKKLELQEKQLKDTQKMDKYRLWGELINTYGYGIAPGSKELTATSYYDSSTVTIPLDETITPRENAKKYFDRYTKLKRTREAVSNQLSETRAEIEHLNSVLTSLELAREEATLSQIRQELSEAGYIKKRDSEVRGPASKRKQEKGKPYHYVSSDGYDIYVGKNNIQNDLLTFNMASGNDWWFHAKKIPGSHVILKNRGTEIPDRAFEEAGALAAYYSKGQNQSKVEIDYVEKKQIKKPAGSKPGFVVYYTNYSLTASPDISGLRLIED